MKEHVPAAEVRAEPADAAGAPPCRYPHRGMAVFFKAGFGGVSIAAIVARAGTSKGTSYETFGNTGPVRSDRDGERGRPAPWRDAWW